MKRIFAAVLAVLMLMTGALAEETMVLTFGAYAQSFAVLTEESGAEWEADGIDQLQMLAAAENVNVSACLVGENIAAVTVEFLCGNVDENVRAAVENLGWLSAEAVDQVVSMEEGAVLEAEGCTVYRVHGENRDAFSICRTENVGNMLWQPIHGGKKIHDTPRCSGMDVSRMITAEAAELIGWENCGTCRAEREPDAEEIQE